MPCEICLGQIDSTGIKLRSTTERNHKREKKKIAPKIWGKEDKQFACLEDC